MNTCANCKFFEPLNTTHGTCTSDKLIEGYAHEPASDTLLAGGYEGYGDYIEVGKDFGCIHFQPTDKQ